MNLGHFIWDELLSLFSMLDLFHLINDDGQMHDSSQPIPLFVEKTGKHFNFGGSDPMWRCSPANWRKWNHCVKKYRKLYHLFFGVRADSCNGDVLRTGNWLRGELGYGDWIQNPYNCSYDNNTNKIPEHVEYIHLPRVLAGTGRLNFYGCEGDCSIGRGPQWRRFRNFLAENVETYTPSSSKALAVTTTTWPRIVFSLPVGSSRPDQVSFFEQEIALARAKDGNDTVAAVDMAELSVYDQMKLVQNAAVSHHRLHPEDLRTHRAVAQHLCSASIGRDKPANRG